MLFDKDKNGNFISDSKKLKKISEAVLKYIIVKYEFTKNTCLYNNDMFKKYFTDLYVLKTGAWKGAVSQEIFYRLFQSIKENYSGKLKFCNNCESIDPEKCILKNIYKEIFILLSHIAGQNERSFSSKILHTLCNNSPIIDNNVLKALSINDDDKNEDIDLAQAVRIYNKLLDRYYSKNDFDFPKKKEKKYSGKGFVHYLNQGFYDEFNNVCLQYINDNSASFNGIFDDMKRSFNKSGKELKSEIEKQIKNISEVKKIDFYLWALWAK